MSILDHKWGESRCIDRVCSVVAGMRPMSAVGRRVLALQIYIDESWKDDGYFVLAGFIAPIEKWVAFSKEWEKMLPYGVINKDGEWQVKMSEMTSPDGLERVKAFWRIIESYVSVAVLFRFKISDLHAAKGDVLVGLNGIDFSQSDWGNPYFFACRNLLNAIYSHAPKFPDVFPEGEAISFIFDERSDKAPVRDVWDWMRNDAKLFESALVDSDPRFEDDKLFLPLQAADLLAWWVRHWMEEGVDVRSASFPTFDGKSRLAVIDHIAHRERIRDFFAGTAVEELKRQGKESIVFIRDGEAIIPFRKQV